MSAVVQLHDDFVWRDPIEELAHANELASYARRLHVLGPIQKRLTLTLTNGQLGVNGTLHYREEVDRLIAMLSVNRELLPASPFQHEG